MVKVVFLLFFITIPLLCLSQYELIINPTYCQGKGQKSFFDHELRLYQDGKLITEEIYPVNHYTISNLAEGTYLIKFKNIFDQDFVKEVKIERKITILNLCIDEYIPLHKDLLVNALVAGDTMEFSSYTTGCYYENYGTLKIIKENKNYKAIFKKGNTVKVKKRLSKSQLVKLAALEQKFFLLDNVEMRGYTNTFHYYIKINDKFKMSTEYGLDYDLLGFAYLIKKIVN